MEDINRGELERKLLFADALPEIEEALQQAKEWLHEHPADYGIKWACENAEMLRSGIMLEESSRTLQQAG